MQPIKLYESLFILHKCNLNLERLKNLMRDAIKNDNIDTNADLYACYINLEAVSFLEEFRDGLSKSELTYTDRIKEFRKITSPVLKRVNKWTDLKKFRDCIVAHPWRDKKGKFVLPIQGYFDVPRNWFEITVLLYLMGRLWTLVTAEFGKEIDESLRYVSTLQLDPKPSNDYDDPNDYNDLNCDHLKMAEEVAQQCNRFQKNYSLKVLQYDLPHNDK